MAVKVASKINHQVKESLVKEIYNHRSLERKGVTRIPKFLGEGYFGEFPFSKSEYLEYSIEEYLKLDAFPAKLKMEEIFL